MRFGNYYALSISGRLKGGDNILIHTGTVGTVINLALYEGYEVFTAAVATLNKRRCIRETFPHLPDNHIGNSRDTSLEQMIAGHTNGYGVNVVDNSLDEENLQAFVRCLAVGRCQKSH